MFVTPRLPAAVAICGFVAAVLPWPVAAACGLGGILVLVVALDVIRAPAPSRLRVSRRHPDVTTIGRTETVSVLIHNPVRRTLGVWVRDAVPPSLRRRPLRHHTKLPSGGWDRLDAEIVPSRRGFIPLGPVTVRAAGPLGMAGRQATLPLAGRVKVYPALPSGRKVRMRLDRARQVSSGQRATMMRGGATDFDSLREYHPDDEFRRINWRATARAPHAVSNVYREERNQQVLLMLDAGRMMAASLDGVSRFEHAIDAAVAVAELMAKVGDAVGAFVFSADVVGQIDPRSGNAQARRILDMLFSISPTLQSANYRLAFGRLLARHRRRSLIVLLTELADEVVMEPLIAAVPSLVARHLVVVGSTFDPAVAALAESTPSSSAEAYAKAAAMGSLLARRRAASRLGAMGVAVVDRPPGELGPALADHYLRMKTLGRL